MAIHYQKLTETELPTFIDMRIQQLREEGATEDIDLKSALFDYYHKHLADGTFVSWLALDGATIIGTSGSLLSRNRLILAAQVEKSGCFPACLPIRTIADRVLPKNYCP